MGKYMMIDGIRVEFTDEKNILQVIHKANIHIPTFCYYTDMSIYGACRMCVVEKEDGSIVAACSTPPKDKLVIRTNSPKIHHHRKMILELLLASHCRDCTTCEKCGKCRLQMLASRFGLLEVRFENTNHIKEVDHSSKSIVFNPNKCILCGDCVRMCNEVQNVGAINFSGRGADLKVAPTSGKRLCDTDCVDCGQCSAVCPTAAITVKQDIKAVWQALYDPKKRVVLQVAPAVRVALGEEFGLEPGKNTMGKIYTAARTIGFEAVYDTALGADLTIMEESKELLEQIEEKAKTGDKWPMFTSCCPGWIRYVETKHPELFKYVSSCKSPMQMMGVMLKEYYRELDEKQGMETVSVAVMPCTAKKYEADRDVFKRNGIPDVDVVITTTEFARMIKEIGIQYNDLEPEGPDMPFSINSGAGTIFGVTGGVAEAAVRRVCEQKTNAAIKEIEYIGLRGMEGVKTAEIPYGDRNLRVAVVSGLGNAEKLIEKIKNDEDHFDFVEVMACPYGCISGAGQPFVYKEGKEKRAAGLYKSDNSSLIRRSEDNPVIHSLYHGGIIEGREHELLHVSYVNQEK